MIFSGTPAEVLEFLRLLCGFCRREAVALTLSGTLSKGRPMNPVVGGPGLTVNVTVKGTDDAGAPAQFKSPLAWSVDSGVSPPPALTPAADSFSAVAVYDPSILTGTSVITATYTRSDAVVVTGTLAVNIAEGEATKLILDGTIVMPTGP